MTSFTVYKASSGAIVVSGQCPDDMVAAQADAAAGEAAMEGESNPNTQQVDITDPANPVIVNNAGSPSPLPIPPPDPIWRDIVAALAANGYTITTAQVEAKRDARLGL
jgi:hypothetical protein